MTAVLPAVLMAFTLAIPVSGQPDAACDTGVRHVELPAVPGRQTPAVCVSPGWPTLFSFDTGLVAASLSLEGHDGFTLVEQGQSTLKLVPSERLATGRRLLMTVRFEGGAAPASAAFMLVVQAARAEPLVNVYRQLRSAESYMQELEELKGKVQQCHEERSRLRAERGGPGGIVGLHAAGLMDVSGVSSHIITTSVTQAATEALRVTRVAAYRTAQRVAVEVVLQFPAGAPPWKPESATLVLQGRKGAGLDVVTLWPTEPIVPSAVSGTVFVEADATPDLAVGNFTLRLTDASGARTVTIRGIRFP